MAGRSDQQKYATGLSVCTNAWVTRYGTVENRSGTLYDLEVKDSDERVRTVPFIFSSDISYLLEFGHHYIRVIQNGARISVVGAAAYAGGTTYDIGDLVTSVGIVYYSITDANIGNTPASNPTDWYPQTGGFLEIPTDIPQAALALFQYVQKNDVMTLTSHLFHPKRLRRFSNTHWTFDDFVQTTGLDAPVNVVVVAGVGPSSPLDEPNEQFTTGGDTSGPPAVKDSYYITAWSATQQSSADGPYDAGSNAVATVADPIVIDWLASAGADGYAIYCQRGSTGPYGLLVIVPSTITIFSDDGSIDPSASGIATVPLGTPGSTTFTYVVTAIDAVTEAESLASDPDSTVGGTPTDANPNVITWDTVTGAASYRIYRVVGGVPGFIGESTTTTFEDSNFLPDTSIQPPVTIELFATSDDYPAVCGYYQQRLIFANTINAPQTMTLSRVGNDADFTFSTPPQDNDAFSVTIAGSQVQEIRALVDLGKLIVHTSNAEYIFSGDQSGTVTPLNNSIFLNGSAGSELVRPVVLGNTDLFIQDGATRLLDLRYEIQSTSYAGKDLTKFAPELFAGRTIVDMAWQKLPHSIVWCVLDNGVVIALTYVREDELWAWHAHHSTNGMVENVVVIPEGDLQVVYFVIRREIDGDTKRYHEHLADRACLDQVFYSDSVFADSAEIFDGRNDTATTMTATTGAEWTTSDLITLTASASYFAIGDIGNVIVLQQRADGTQIDEETGLPYDVGRVLDQVSIEILGFTSSTVVTGEPQREVPAWARATATLTWGKAVDSFSGLDHIEGEELSILADGNVVADPQDDALPVVTVTAGAFTLAEPAMVVVAGLSLQMDLQTLPLENAQGESIANKRLQVREVCPVFYNARGGLYGMDRQHLDAWKQPTTSAMGYPPSSVTGPWRVPIRGTSQRTGQLWVRNSAPVPWGMSAVVITGEIGN
ncbi:MAG: hypothetical protein V4636_12890 [Pseudomonadota bacterium]